MYERGFSIKAIAPKFNVSRQAIKSILDRNNVLVKKPIFRRRKYQIDEKYFEEIDSPQKAYWLGWLYSDGNNYENTGVIKLELHAKDGYIVNLLKTDLKSEHPIKEFDKKSTYKGYTWVTPVISFSFASQKLSNDLIQHGCVGNKSLIVGFPRLKKELYVHFLRGVFEGDGCLHKRKGKLSYVLRIAGSNEFCYRANEWLKNHMDLAFFLGKTGKNSSLTLSNRQNILRFLDSIYNDAKNHVLPRKYELYRKLESELRVK